MNNCIHIFGIDPLKNLIGSKEYLDEAIEIYGYIITEFNFCPNCGIKIKEDK